jgi:hypothetical protein
MFTHPNGREVYLMKLMITPTYEGCLEGNPEQHTQSELGSLPGKARKHMPPGKPLVVLDPRLKVLPDWIWIAEFESQKGVKTADPDFNSRLYVCWFTDDVKRDITVEIGSILSKVDWESNADDYDITMF